MGGGTSRPEDVYRDNNDEKDSSQPMTFTTNGEGIVLTMNIPMKERGLGYIEGKHFTIIMSPVLGKLHSNVFLPKLGTMNAVERNAILFRIANHASRVSIEINAPIKFFATASITKRKDGCWECRIYPDPKQTAGNGALHLVPPPFRHHCGAVEGGIRADNIGIVAVDLANSTSFLNNALGAFVALHDALYREVIAFVLEYHPVVVLHEVLGDSFCVTVNAPWWSSFQMLESDLHDTLLQLSVMLSTRLDSICNTFSKSHELHVRVGFAIGSAIGKMSGSHFRIYGACMNLAHRMEAICGKNEVCSLGNEEDSDESDLKGFGVTKIARHSTSIKSPAKTFCLPIPNTDVFHINRSRTQSRRY